MNKPLLWTQVQIRPVQCVPYYSDPATQGTPVTGRHREGEIECQDGGEGGIRMGERGMGQGGGILCAGVVECGRDCRG